MGPGRADFELLSKILYFVPLISGKRSPRDLNLGAFFASLTFLCILLWKAITEAQVRAGKFSQYWAIYYLRHDVYKIWVWDKMDH